jgi:hypothetical protein
MRDLQAIADRVEIEALRGEFTDAVMMRDYDRVASLFTPTARWRRVFGSTSCKPPTRARSGWTATPPPAVPTCKNSGAFRDGHSELNYPIYHDRYRIMVTQQDAELLLRPGGRHGCLAVAKADGLALGAHALIEDRQLQALLVGQLRPDLNRKEPFRSGPVQACGLRRLPPELCLGDGPVGRTRILRLKLGQVDRVDQRQQGWVTQVETAADHPGEHVEGYGRARRPDDRGAYRDQRGAIDTRALPPGFGSPADDANISDLPAAVSSSASRPAHGACPPTSRSVQAPPSWMNWSSSASTSPSRRHSLTRAPLRS